RWNLGDWEAYGRAGAAGRSPVASQEVLTDEQRELERVYLALRTDAGLPVAALCRPLPPSAALWQERGWVEIRDERLVCRPEGWLRLDALARDLTGWGITGSIVSNQELGLYASIPERARPRGSRGRAPDLRRDRRVGGLAHCAYAAPAA